MQAATSVWRQFRKAVNVLVPAALIVGAGFQSVIAATTPAPIDLSNIPMVLGQPADPQVLFLLGNSQSMDGDLGGAIMTGETGANGGPSSYDIPSGFTPPETPSATGTAAYTYTSGGVEYDNSPSRLNIAKAAILQTVQDYESNTQFGLMDFKESSSPSVYSTWVYYMSAGPDTAGSQFSFTSTAAGNGVETSQPGTAGSPNTYPNPCYGQSGSTNCKDIAALLGTGADTYNDKYLNAKISSDSPTINDVLYAGNLPSEFVTSNGPYDNSGNNPPQYTLHDYETNSITDWYLKTTYGSGGFPTGPTNAGFLPDSYQVWYSRRGFGYYNTPTGQGNLILPVKTATNQPLSTWQPYLAAETNDPSTHEIKAEAVQSPLAGLVKTAGSYYSGDYSGYSAPTASGGANCIPQRYTVLLTDGLPTEDLDGNSWPPLGSSAAAQYGVSATFYTTGGGTVSTTDPGFASDVANGKTLGLAVSDTNDKAAIDAVNQIQNLAQQNPSVETYVVGLGAGVDPTKNPAAAAMLKAMAIAGGTNNYFSATTPAAVASDLGVILGKIQAATRAASNPAGNSPYLQNLTQVFQTRFTSVDSPYDDWTGNLFSFKVNAQGIVDTNVNNANWSAQAKLDTLAAGTGWDVSRRIVTWNPALNSGAGGGVPFRWSSGTAGTASAISNNQLDELKATSTDTNAQAVARLDYLRGDQSGEGPNTSTDFRQRSHILGDIVNSTPIYVQAPHGPYPDPSYEAFQAQYKNRQAMVYVGANDGMLHAFTADQSGGGQELYAFIPNGVFGNLIKLTEPDYNSNHLFFVDGTPTAGDVQFSNGTWNTILVGGLRNGGKSIYALNITNPPTSSSVTEAQLANNVLWEFTDPDMGQTYSRPMIGRLHDANSSASTPQFVVVFGSGYNNSTQMPYLYFVNAQTGALVDKIDLCSQESSACDPSLPNGLSGPALLAPNGDGIVTTVYVGDLQGNLWKVDISNADPSKWSASVLFKAEGPNNQPQPITTTPVVSLHPLYPAKQGYMVYFGTGKYLGQQDVPNGTTTPQTQTVYGVWDQPTTGNSTTPLTRSKLQSQSLTSGIYTDPTTGAQTSVLLATTNSVNWNTQSGWYMDLDVPPGGGARVIKDPSLDGGRLKFTFYVPPGSSSDSCNAPGQSYLMTLNYANGGAFQAPEFDLNNDGTLNSADQVGVPSGSQYSGNPVGVGLGSGMSSGVIEMSGKPTKSADNGTKLIGMSSGNIVTVHERGGSLAGRMSWRQLK